MGAKAEEPQRPAWSRGRAGRFLAAVATVAALSFMTLPSARSRIHADDEQKALENAGDALRDKAVPQYYRAFEYWESLGALARQIGDHAAVRRSLEARAALAVNLLDPQLFDRLRPVGQGEAWPLTAVATAEPSVASLEQLSRLLAAARRACPRLPESEQRDLLLIEEAQALVHRARADTYQLEADQRYRRALELAKARGSDEPEAGAAAVRLRFKLRDLQGAWHSAGSVATVVSRLGPRAEVRHLRILRTLARFLRQNERALAYRDKLISLGDKAEEKPRIYAPLHRFPVGTRADLVATATTCHQLASTYRLSQRDAALSSYFAALSAMELGEYALAADLLRDRDLAVSDDPWFSAAILARLSYCRDRLGDYEGALRAVRRALELTSSLKDSKVFRARLGLNAAQALVGLGQFIEACAFPREVVKQRDLPADLRVRARILLGSCLYERAREEPSRLGDALRAFATAERELGAAAEKLPHRQELELGLAIHVGNILRLEARHAESREEARRKRSEAIAQQDRAMRRASEAELYTLASVAAANLGELYLEAGKLDTAKSFVGWALGRARELRQFETEWRCHWYLGRIADVEGNTEEADREFAAAARQVESYRARIIDAETKSGFLSDKMDLYRDMVRRELARGRPAQGLEVAERARARALVESLGWRFVTLASAEDTKLYHEFVGLLAREAHWRRESRGRVLGVKAVPPDYEALRRRLEAMRERLRTSGGSTAVHALADGAPATTGEIQRSLGGEDVLLEYFSLGDGMVAFVVDQRGVESVRLGTRSSELAALVRRFLASSAADEKLSRRLHDLVVKPVAHLLKARRLLIVPYGALHQLPFEALRGGDGYVLERWEIAYLPSASLVKYLRWNSRHAGKDGTLHLLALADPDTDYDGDGKRDMAELVHARREVAAFAPNFAQREILSGADAKEAALYRLARGREVIHFACHGEFYPARPWDSTLFLARGSGEPTDDGRLRAFEIYGMDLRGNRLVNLSGCETGRNEVSAGDDPAGIATAFLHSGASSLLVSLWKVEDAATAQLMKSFYRKWIGDGKDRARALRESKLELVRGTYSHPRQWAAFVLIGDR